jgi:hypothetical protein
MDLKKLKTALDALNIALNDQESAITDPRTDDDYEHPFGSKGTEPENTKYGAKQAAGSVNMQTADSLKAKVVAYLTKQGWSTTSEHGDMYHNPSVPGYQILFYVGHVFDSGKTLYEIGWDLYGGDGDDETLIEEGDSYAGLVAIVSELSEGKFKQAAAAGGDPINPEQERIKQLSIKMEDYLVKKGWQAYLGSYTHPAFPNDAFSVTWFAGVRVLWRHHQLINRKWDQVESGETFAGLVATISEVMSSNPKQASEDPDKDVAGLRKMGDYLIKKGWRLTGEDGAQVYMKEHNVVNLSADPGFDRALRFLEKKGYDFHYKNINHEHPYDPGSWAELRPSESGYIRDVDVCETKAGFSATIFLNPFWVRNVGDLPVEMNGALRIECDTYGEFLTNFMKVQEMETMSKTGHRKLRIGAFPVAEDVESLPEIAEQAYYNAEGNELYRVHTIIDSVRKQLDPHKQWTIRQLMEQLAESNPEKAKYVQHQLQQFRPTRRVSSKAVCAACESGDCVPHRAGVDIHETPKLLPQRDDMRTHLDEDLKKELHDEGKVGKLKSAIRLGRLRAAVKKHKPTSGSL